jgi:putative transposase
MVRETEQNSVAEVAKKHGVSNCYDNAVAESFFSSLKKERIRKKSYRTRAEARADVFDYIEVSYNRKRRDSHIGDMSPAAFEAVRSNPSPVSTQAG